MHSLHHLRSIHTNLLESGKTRRLWHHSFRECPPFKNSKPAPISSIQPTNLIYLKHHQDSFIPGKVSVGCIMTAIYVAHQSCTDDNQYISVKITDLTTNPSRDASPPLRTPMKVHFRIAVHCFVFTSSTKTYSH
jgi:hypothetical protein